MSQQTQERTEARPTMVRVLLAGIISTLTGTVLSLSVYFIMRSATGLNPPQLTAFIIFMASLVTNLIGSVVYYTLYLLTRKPKRIFAILALLIATLDSVFVLFDPTPGLSLIAIPLHYIMALTAIYIIPRFTARK